MTNAALFVAFTSSRSEATSNAKYEILSYKSVKFMPYICTKVCGSDGNNALIAAAAASSLAETERVLVEVRSMLAAEEVECGIGLLVLVILDAVMPSALPSISGGHEKSRLYHRSGATDNSSSFPRLPPPPAALSSTTPSLRLPTTSTDAACRAATFCIPRA
eukprot:CAMPEP_0175084450 /NCGR_PEP_ID=MMETSP0052_2-20121109/28067_1 /TAXON_ID=51329 ORGANISM="Polytomella parva, Strain SAG 63-3" /NCGR_SAMPLE_ID=MMETSP0052_2 /ASSEMBLY_ACC=CAM_ASM_000194 /LENGTH=161 /DNA_ID=CAMNT_0016356257 /DNA_START=233 /DNA_END=716 /DNA_ORIENTATION=-